MVVSGWWWVRFLETNKYRRCNCKISDRNYRSCGISPVEFTWNERLTTRNYSKQTSNTHRNVGFGLYVCIYSEWTLSVLIVAEHILICMCGISHNMSGYNQHEDRWLTGVHHKGKTLSGCSQQHSHTLTAHRIVDKLKQRVRREGTSARSRMWLDVLCVSYIQTYKQSIWLPYTMRTQLSS